MIFQEIESKEVLSWMWIVEELLAKWIRQILTTLFSNVEKQIIILQCWKFL